MPSPDDLGPDPIDAHVGRRLVERRTELGLSQSDLARSVNLTFQQIQKYEKAGNRVSASKLWAMGEFLKVPVGYFFDGLGGAELEPLVVNRGKPSRYSAEVNRLLPTLPPRHQKLIAELVRGLTVDSDRDAVA